MKTILIEKKIKRKKLVVPPGWYITVPEVTADQAALSHYASYFQSRGATPVQARDRAREIIQRVLEGYYRRHIREFVGKYAVEYMKRFGDLEGFDPSELQKRFVPFDNYSGRGGHSWVNGVFAEMRGDR